VCRDQILAYSCGHGLTKTFSGKIQAEFAVALLARCCKFCSKISVVVTASSRGLLAIWAHCHKLTRCLISITDSHKVD
jgi:hypothetical protein